MRQIYNLHAELYVQLEGHTLCAGLGALELENAPGADVSECLLRAGRCSKLLAGVNVRTGRQPSGWGMKAKLRAATQVLPRSQQQRYVTDLCKRCLAP